MLVENPTCKDLTQYYNERYKLYCNNRNIIIPNIHYFKSIVEDNCKAFLKKLEKINKQKLKEEQKKEIEKKAAVVIDSVDKEDIEDILIEKINNKKKSKSPKKNKKNQLKKNDELDIKDDKIKATNEECEFLESHNSKYNSSGK